jgi:hypothetical protein
VPHRQNSCCAAAHRRDMNWPNSASFSGVRYVYIAGAPSLAPSAQPMKHATRSLLPSHAARLISMLCDSPRALPISMLARRHASYDTGSQSGSLSTSSAASRSTPWPWPMGGGPYGGGGGRGLGDGAGGGEGTPMPHALSLYRCSVACVSTGHSLRTQGLGEGAVGARRFECGRARH